MEDPSEAVLYVDFDTPRLPTAVREPRSNDAHEIRPPPPGPKFVSPRSWSTRHKQVITSMCCAAATFASFASSSYAPSKGQLTREWHVSDTAVLVGITAFTTGFGLAPMVLAPVSEVWGRKPVFGATGVLFLGCQVACALTRSYAGMLVARFFAGVGSSTFSTLVGGVLSDIYESSRRGTPMAIFSFGALFGIGLGPSVCGFAAQYATWRWSFWLQVVSNGILVAMFALFLPETRSVVILRARARQLNEWYAAQGPGVVFLVPSADPADPGKVVRHVRWVVREDESRGSILQAISVSAYRPFQLLLTEPVVSFFSLWATFSWAVLYLALAAIPLVFTDVYAFDLSSANAVFASSCVFSVLAVGVSIAQESWLDRRRFDWLKLDSPERRLYFSCFESAFLPAGLFMFGWTAQADVHWIAPALAIGISTLGIFSVYLSVFNYLSDTYHAYASSALASQSFCRNVVGGVLPLVTTKMYTRLGYGPASSLLGGLGLALTAGPWVLVIYGEKIRAMSRFAQKLD